MYVSPRALLCLAVHLSLSLLLSLYASFSQALEPVWLNKHGLAAGFLMFTPVVDAKIGQAYRAPPTRKRKKRSAAKTWGRLGTLQTVRRHLSSFDRRSFHANFLPLIDLVENCKIWKFKFSYKRRDKVSSQNTILIPAILFRSDTEYHEC